MNRAKASSKTGYKIYICIFALLVATLLFGFISAEAATTSEITRSSELNLAHSTSEDAIVQTSSQPTIKENTTSQDFATVTNNYESTVDYTITLTPGAADYISFRSTLSTTTTSKGDVATATLEPGETATIVVDAEANASQNLNTSPFHITGVSSKDGFKLQISKDGPDVVAE